MTTARDVIAEWFVKTGFTPLQADTWAGRLMDHLKAADEPGRLDLAGMLNPWRPADSAPKDGAPFLAELCGNSYAVVFHDPHPDHGEHVWPTEDGIRYRRGALTRWMPLPLPAPPSEDKPK